MVSALEDIQRPHVKMRDGTVTNCSNGSSLPSCSGAGRESYCCLPCRMEAALQGLSLSFMLCDVQGCKAQSYLCHWQPSSPPAPDTSNSQLNLVALERRNTGSQISNSDIGSSAFLLLLNSFYSNSIFTASTKPHTGGKHLFPTCFQQLVY